MPKPQTGTNGEVLQCGVCYGGFYYDTPSLPRKEVISIQPGDVIVLKHPDFLTKETVSRIIKTVEGVWPNNKCLVLDNGMSLEVYREQEYVHKDEDTACERTDCGPCAVKCDWYLEKTARERNNE
jgi:hypothetical protein